MADSYPDYSYSDSDSENEKSAHYREGGYHTVKVGDVYNGKYKIEKKLGWGHFSTVWLASDSSKSEKCRYKYVAVKFHKSARHYSKSALIELSHLQKIRSRDVYGEKNVVSLLDCFCHYGPNGRHVCFVFEVLGENLLRYFRKKEKDLQKKDDIIKGSLFPLKEVKLIVKDVLEGLDFLHNKCKLIHTDIKPENISLSLEKKIDIEKIREEEVKTTKKETTKDIFKVEKKQKKRSRSTSTSSSGLSEALCELAELSPGAEPKKLELDAFSSDSDNGEKVTMDKFKDLDTKYVPRIKSRRFAKIVDLGNSVVISDANRNEITTRQYRSPEVILGQKFTSAVDIWALACVVFEICTGCLLFTPRTPENQRYTQNHEHLAYMIELVGKFPRQMTKFGAKAKVYFNSAGKLKKVTGLSPWSLEDILIDKYQFEQKEATELSGFLLPMLSLDPKKRTTAEKALKHKWLDEVNGKDFL